MVNDRSTLDDNIGMNVYALSSIPDKAAFDAFCKSVVFVFDEYTNPHVVVDLDNATRLAEGAVVGVYFDSVEKRDAALTAAREWRPEPAFSVYSTDEDEDE